MATLRDAGSDEVKRFKLENEDIKKAIAEDSATDELSYKEL